MLINFNEMLERTSPGMNGGTGEMTAKMYMSEKGKIIPCTIHKGGSIGLHTQSTSDDDLVLIMGWSAPAATILKQQIQIVWL